MPDPSPTSSSNASAISSGAVCGSASTPGGRRGSRLRDCAGWTPLPRELPRAGVAQSARGGDDHLLSARPVSQRLGEDLLGGTQLWPVSNTSIPGSRADGSRPCLPDFGGPSRHRKPRFPTRPRRPQDWSVPVEPVALCFPFGCFSPWCLVARSQNRYRRSEPDVKVHLGAGRGYLPCRYRAARRVGCRRGQLRQSRDTATG